MTLVVCLAALASTLGAVDAPITAVTVYSDRARVTRTATVRVSGTQRLDFPALPEGVDSSTLRLEATGADVRAVDLSRLEPGELPVDEGRKLLQQLEALEDQQDQIRAERDAHRTVLGQLGGVRPAAPAGEPLRPAPKLDPGGWSQAEGFLADYTARLQAKVRELDARLEDLDRKRGRAQEEARLLGAVKRSGGERVSVLVHGNGTATLTLSYAIARAGWLPTYDFQLLPESNQVRISFAGLVSQQTGEDWRDAALTLSTAVPATSTVLPRLLAWKLGEKERFIPTPAPRMEPVLPPPAAPPPPRLTAEVDRLREQLVARAGQREDESRNEQSRMADDKRPTSGKDLPPEPPPPPPPPPPAVPKPSPSGPAGSSGIVGVVIDAVSRQPVGDVVVTATSPAVNGEQVVVTDGSGFYRVPSLPAGQYALRLEREGYRPYSRQVDVSPGANRRVDAELQPEAFKAEEIVVVGHAPTIDTGSSSTGMSFGGNSRDSALDRLSASGETTPTRVSGSLAPPSGYVAPRFDPELPAALAGGYDLGYPSLRRETLESGKGARRVALFSETWPVMVERKVFPALAAEAFLVAEIKSPSARVLPGGTAHLSVGDDPAGSARIKLVAPGESFTLPLGIDRAIKPVRNVQLVQSEKGVIGKDDVGEYTVTDELANPYPFPIKTRIYDQWPLAGDKDVELLLLRAEPWAIQDKKKGSLEWDLTVPAHGKVVVTFAYSLRRPKGWRLHQDQ